MANERITEGIVRDFFRADAASGLMVEEQASIDPAIARALKAASKQGGGIGKPEFIITHPDNLEEVVLVECKADTNCHESARHKAGEASTAIDIQSCAVDGVLHYAKHVVRHRNVIAVAVSGQNKSALRISTYRQIKGTGKADLLLDLQEHPVERLKPFRDYVHLFRFDRAVCRGSFDQLMAHTREVHNFLRDYAKVTEAEKPLVISAVLLALRHPAFRKSWGVTADQDLATATYEAVEKSVRKAISSTKRELMMAAYEFLKTHPELTKQTRIRLKRRPEQKASPLRYLLHDIESEVLPFSETYPDIDVIGQFYAEFLRYTGGDGKGLGIVLTPRHLTELFVGIIQIGKSDTVLDACAGTGGFLISAMAAMDRQARGDDEAKRMIREKQLIGIEQQSAMFALCVSNMVLRGDGRSNLHRGDCFDPELQGQIMHPTRAGMQRPNKGLLNPPYSQKGEEQHELDFVKAMMDMLSPGGLGVAVVPMSCAIAPDKARSRLLEAHTLVAAMSLPDELFKNGAVPCALIFRAHTPHEDSNAPTWFGYWKDDGFVKAKHKGRIDLYQRWPSIRDQWLADYRSMAEVPGRCVKRRVTLKDEWCAEAYIETDYSQITQEDFAKVVRNYAIFRLLGVQPLNQPEEE